MGHHHREKSGKKSENFEKKGRLFEGVRKDEKRNVPSDVIIKASHSYNYSHSEKESKPAVKTMHRGETNNDEVFQNRIDNEIKVMEAKEKDVLLSDTDSEFDRLSDIEREMENEGY